MTIQLGSKFQYSPESQCVSMRTLQSVLNGKWKILILWYIASFKVRRFGELRRQISEITQSTLTKQLRELGDDGFVSRTVYQEIPPKVEYTLTERGRSFIPLLVSMMEWSQQHLCAGATPQAMPPAKPTQANGAKNDTQTCA